MIKAPPGPSSSLSTTAILLGLLLLAVLGSGAVSSLVVETADHSQRNEKLIELIAKERILGEAPAGISKQIVEGAKSWTFRNATGQRFQCFEPAEQKSTVSIDSESGRTPSEAPAKSVVFSQAALDARVELLRGTCLTHDGGWWLTRWCHGTEVRQSHYEGAREVTSYSLGTFVAGKTQFVQSTEGFVDDLRITGQSLQPDMSAKPLYYSERFANGQVCDETGESRKTEVRLYCCPADRTVTLVSLQETTVCQYTMTICWASLCEAGLPPLSSTSRDAWSAVRPLTGLCFRNKGDSGWTHEVCFEKGVRTFRQVVAKDLPGGKRNQPQNMRILELDAKQLGAFDALKTFNDDGNTIPANQNNQLMNQKEESAESSERMVLQVYSNGDACGSDDKHETHLKIACFLTKTTPPEIVSVRWITKCRNLVLMHSPGLCETDYAKRFKKRRAMPLPDNDEGDVTKGPVCIPVDA